MKRYRALVADHDAPLVPRTGRTLEDEYRELSAEFLQVEASRDRLAEQLQGAVDLLHELADAVAENQASPDVRYSHRVREALEAIDAAGYRPSTRGQ